MLLVQPHLLVRSEEDARRLVEVEQLVNNNLKATVQRNGGMDFDEITGEATLSTCCNPCNMTYRISPEMVVLKHEFEVCKDTKIIPSACVPSNVPINLSCPCVPNTISAVVARAVIPSQYPDHKQLEEFLKFSWELCKYIIPE